MTALERSDRGPDTADEPTERPDRPDPRGTASTALVAIGAAGVGLMLAWIVGGGIAPGSEMALFLAAGPVGALLGLLGITRFETFVLLVLLVRPSLDAVGGADSIGPGALLSSMFLVMASGWLFVQHRSGEWRRLGPTTRAMTVFLVALVLSTVTSVVRVVSAQAVLEIAAGVAMFLVLEQLLGGRPDRLRRITWAVLLSAVIPVTVGLQQWITGTGMSVHSDVPRVHGTFVHPNPFATYLILVVILGTTAAILTSAWRRWALFAGVGLAVLVIVVTYNRSGWVALLVSLGYLGLRRSPWIVVALFASVVAIGSFVPGVSERVGDLSEDRSYLPEGVPQNSWEWRLQYWGELVPLARSSPVTGIGPQAVVATHPERLEPHNVIVQSYVETGIFGLVALGAVLVAASGQMRRRRREATTSFERAHAHAAIAAGLAILVLLPSENLLNQTMTWWYLAACTAWGFTMLRPPHTWPAPRAPRDARPDDALR